MKPIKNILHSAAMFAVVFIVFCLVLLGVDLNKDEDL